MLQLNKFVIPAPTCLCMNDALFEGNEYCQGDSSKESDGTACYVKMPSNCKILNDSKAYYGLQLSKEPCIGII